ncbi:hypothetical protein BELL_0142g00130 [Botrytis elliptica]|uniref:Uncharacterized protein n=1 Tax=Botrytis elliptica TaxID=278938 RepID=A0A4Z1JST5_9HELO|nr:hypothetical protein BELL_0142g00130 [Botrytis elliptica]
MQLSGASGDAARFGRRFEETNIWSYKSLAHSLALFPAADRRAIKTAQQHPPLASYPQMTSAKLLAIAPQNQAQSFSIRKQSQKIASLLSSN